jgi:hypothetical protein
MAQWLRGSDLECLDPGSQLNGSITWLDLDSGRKRIKKYPTIFLFIFELWKKKERIDF